MFTHNIRVGNRAKRFYHDIIFFREFKIHTTVYRLPSTAVYRLPSTTIDCCLPSTVDYHLYRLPIIQSTGVYRLPSTIDYRLPSTISTVYCLPSTVYRLPSTVYLPSSTVYLLSYIYRTYTVHEFHEPLISPGVHH